MSEEEVVVEESASWRDSISEEYRDHPSLQNYDDINKLVKTHINQEKLIGQKSIPKEDASDEEWSEFYKRVGRPEDASGYGIEDEIFSEIADTALAAGLNKKQAKALADRLSELKKSNDEVMNKQFETHYAKLVEKYGSEEATEEVLNKADQYAKDTFSEYPEFIEFLSSATIKTPEGEVLLGNHPVIAEALKVMFEKTADDNKKIEDEKPDAAKDPMLEYKELTAEMSKYKGDRLDPEYQKMQARMAQIMSQK